MIMEELPKQMCATPCGMYDTFRLGRVSTARCEPFSLHPFLDATCCPARGTCAFQRTFFSSAPSLCTTSEWVSEAAAAIILEPKRLRKGYFSGSQKEINWIQKRKRDIIKICPPVAPNWRGRGVPYDWKSQRLDAATGSNENRRILPDRMK